MICELALILALDVSGSVSGEHFRLQRDATAEALSYSMRPSAAAPIAVQVIMWETLPHVVIDWTILRSASDVRMLATQLQQVERPGMASTNLTTLMNTALDNFAHAPCVPERQVLDVSGDGASDEADMDQAQARAEAMGVQVNGLPIVTTLQPYDIVEYFRQQVITPDGFVIAAHTWQDFAHAIRSKLALEISHQMPESVEVLTP